MKKQCYMLLFIGAIFTSAQSSSPLDRMVEEVRHDGVTKGAGILGSASIGGCLGVIPLAIKQGVAEGALENLPRTLAYCPNVKSQLEASLVKSYNRSVLRGGCLGAGLYLYNRSGKNPEEITFSDKALAAIGVAGIANQIILNLFNIPKESIPEASVKALNAARIRCSIIGSVGTALAYGALANSESKSEFV